MLQSGVPNSCNFSIKHHFPTVVYISIALVLTATAYGECYFYSGFTDEEIEVHKDHFTCRRLQSYYDRMRAWRTASRPHVSSLCTALPISAVGSMPSSCGFPFSLHSILRNVSISLVECILLEGPRVFLRKITP